MDEQQLKNCVEHINNGTFNQLDSAEQARLVNAICHDVAHAYEDFGSTYAKLHPTISPHSKKIVDALVKQLGNAGQKSVLDIGPGSGVEATYFAAHPHIHIQALESCAYFVKICQQLEQEGRLPTGAIQQGDMRNLPYPDETFDLVFAKASLLHMPYVQNQALGVHQVFSEMRRTLKQDGLLYILCREGAGCGIEEKSARFFQYFSKNDLRQLCAKHKFTIKTLEEETNTNFKVTSWQNWLSLTARKN